MSPSATLETARTVLDPGGAASVPMTVHNDRRVVDEYRFRVVGPLARWTTVEPATVSVYPGHAVTVTVLFRAPRSWEVPAGHVPYGVQVLPAQHPEDSVVVEGVVEVQPFHEIVAELVPRTSEGRSGGQHRVAVDNRGNTTVDVTLTPDDPEERLHLGLRPPRLRIVPGTVQSADLTVQPVRRIWRGTRTAHPFTVSVDPDRGPGSLVAGTHRQNPLLPGWSPRLLKYLVVLLLIGGLIWAVLEGVQRVQRAVPRVVDYIETCVAAIVAGDGVPVCLGAAPPGREGAGAGQGGNEAGAEAGGQPGGEREAVTAELAVRAGEGEDDQDVFEAEESVTEFTRLGLSTSEGAVGVFALSLDGSPLGSPIALEQIDGQEQEIAVQIRMTAGQELQLDLECFSTQDRPVVPDACEVTAELEGVVVPQGG